MSTVFIPFHYSSYVKILATAVRLLKDMKGVLIGKKDDKVSLLAGDMTVRISDPRNPL